jgi:hypothetical protein
MFDLFCFFVTGTLGNDIGQMVKTFKDGIQFSVNVEDREKEYGWIDTCIGTVRYF